MKAKIEVIKICAIGYNHHFMTYKQRNGKEKTIHIDEDLYIQLKEQKIPTAQSLRKKNDSKNN